MRLLYARGVERYRTPFEFAMLESQYGFLVCTFPLSLPLRIPRKQALRHGENTVPAIDQVPRTLLPPAPAMANPHPRNSSPIVSREPTAQSKMEDNAVRRSARALLHHQNRIRRDVQDRTSKATRVGGAARQIDRYGVRIADPGPELACDRSGSRPGDEGRWDPL